MAFTDLAEHLTEVFSTDADWYDRVGGSVEHRRNYNTQFMRDKRKFAPKRIPTTSKARLQATPAGRWVRQGGAWVKV